MALNSTSWAWPTTVTGTGWTATTGTLADAVLSDDTNYASSTSPLSSTPLQMSDWVTAPATPIAIPPGATPVGLEIKFLAFCASATIPPLTTDVAFRFGFSPGSMIYDEKTAPVININYYIPTETTFGGSNDLWGGGWTDAQAEGAALHFYGAGFAGFPATRYLDYILMRIWYTDGAVIGPGGILAGDVLKYTPNVSVRGTGFGVRK